MVVFSLGKLVGLMIVTGEGYFVGLSLVLPLGYPLQYTNPGDDMPDMLPVAPLGFGFGSEAIRCRCY